MNIAQQILGSFPQGTHIECVTLEQEIREIATSTRAPNCFDRVWTFYDGSMITKDCGGYSELAPCQLRSEYVKY